MVKEVKLNEELQSEGWDITTSHNIGYKAYQKEKLFTSISLNGLVLKGSNFKLAMVVKELATIFNVLSNYSYLHDKGELSDIGNAKENTNNYKVELDNNKVSLDKIETKLDNLESSLGIEDLKGAEDLTPKQYANLETFNSAEEIFNTIFEEFYVNGVESTEEDDETKLDDIFN